MNCREVRRWLSPYLDSELGKTKTFEVSEHLRQCEPCALRFQQERRVDSLVVEKLSETPSMDFGVMVREAAQSKRSLLGPWRIGLTGLAACIALVAWFSVGTSPVSATGIENWIDAEFATASTDANAFVPAPQGSVDLAGQVKSALGISLSMTSIAEAFSGHDVKLVSVSNRETKDRVRFVEIRLNCCGEPVLLTLATRSAIAKLGSLPDGVESGVNRRHPSSGLNMTLWATDEFLLVAASHHATGDFAPSFLTKAA